MQRHTGGTSPPLTRARQLLAGRAIVAESRETLINDRLPLVRSSRSGASCFRGLRIWHSPRIFFGLLAAACIALGLSLS
jgi:hypothetical protein